MDEERFAQGLRSHCDEVYEAIVGSETPLPQTRKYDVEVCQLSFNE